MERGLLEAVRRGCRKVAAGAGSVQIEDEAIDPYAAALAESGLNDLRMDPESHYLGHGPGTVAFFLVLDTVNFGSGYFPEIFGPTRSGYSAIAAALAARFQEGKGVSAAELCRLTPEAALRLFRLDPANRAAAELAGLYARALNDLGRALQDRWQGEAEALVAAVGGSAERLVGLLQTMPFFDDVARWQGIDVPFFKRAQLLAVDLHIAFAGQGAGRFDDLDDLTICADNLVPHVLRHDGILAYRPDLAERIDAGLPLAAGSVEETEIRAAAVEAGERIVTALRRQGVAASPYLLDNLLWHRGQAPRYRARPRHRTRTVFY